VSGNSDPTSLVAMPQRYKAKFIPRDLVSLDRALRDFKVVDAIGA
jgi:3-hydroxyphenylacetate 6-hydroxylase